MSSSARDNVVVETGSVTVAGTPGPEAERAYRAALEEESRECMRLGALVAAAPILLAAMPLILAAHGAAELFAWARRRASAAHGAATRTEEARHA